MDKKIIVYASTYGSTKRYAEQLAQETGIEARPYNKAKDINDYDTIVYMAPLFAGGMKGWKQTQKRIAAPQEKKITLVTVGLADPTDPKNVNHIREGIRKMTPPELFDKIRIEHLRGGIDYQRLNWMHGILMRMLVNKVKKMPREQWDSEVTMMMETYGKKVDFVDFDRMRSLALI